MKWISIEEALPPEDNKYFIHAASMDENMPLYAVAWYNPAFGWSLLPEVWINAITHWMKPEPPKET